MMRKWRRSAAYRIAFANLITFAVGLALLGLVVFGVMHVAFVGQLDATVSDEAQTLVDEYHTGGIGEVRDAIAVRESSTSPTRMLFAVFAPDGRRIAGSLQTDRPSLGVHDIIFIDPQEGPDSGRGIAIDLSSRERLLVAADREWVERIDRTVISVFAVAFLVACLIAFGGAVWFGSYLRRRINSIGDTAKVIIGGDIRERMPVSGRGDEFDQLAGTLNRMLDRLQTAVDRERRVVDSASHELRTPLANLKAELDLALRQPRTDAELIAALHSRA